MNGCRHSTDKMDTINFLLTEVSLGLLGNSFFDIHGNNVKSLNLLVSKQSSQHIERTPGEVPLLKKLKLSEQHIAKGIYAQKLKAAQFHPYKKPEKLRRLSHSDISSTNAPPPVNIPAKPQSARIRERRSTCIGERPTAIALAPPKPVGKQIVIIKPPGMNANRPPLEILQRDLKIEMRSMMAASKVDRKRQVQKLLTDGSCSSVQEALATFHQLESRHLLKTSNSLMEFIRYINRDNSNNGIISDIVKSILALKESM